jgi:hypothetical protein
VLTLRFGNYFAEQLVYAGQSTPDGPRVVELISQQLSQSNKATMINIDVIGVGSSVYDYCKSVLSINVYAINSSESSNKTDKPGNLGFYNKRSEMWWRLREALNPFDGDELALPDDRELLADLTAPRWSLSVRGIKVEPKDDIKKRIGRSPDKGDSLVYAHHITNNEVAFLCL